VPGCGWWGSPPSPPQDVSLSSPVTVPAARSARCGRSRASVAAVVRSRPWESRCGRTSPGNDRAGRRSGGLRTCRTAWCGSPAASGLRVSWRISRKRAGIVPGGCRSVLPFTAQQFALAFHAPAVAGELAVAAHDAMAGNHHRQAVGRAGAGHGAYRPGLLQPIGQLGVAEGGAGRNVPQGLPDAGLEGGAANVQRQVQAAPRVLDHCDHLVHHGGEVVVRGPQLRPWKAPAQLAQQLFRLVTQQDGTDAPAALTDHYLAQAGVTQGVADGFPTAALAVATR